MIRLVEDTISKKEILELSDWLRTFPRLTKGPLTEELEQKFAEYIGTKYSVFVNSGSSAILLMLASLLANKSLRSYDTVIVPRLSWATDAASVINVGLRPIFVDSNTNDLSVDLCQLEKIFNKEEPKALLLVSVLGLVPDMAAIKELCDTYEVLLLEDVCESFGSEFGGKKLGSIGYASVFSGYFGHHISTIEGGWVCTDDRKYYNILKSLRSHGWGRDLDKDIYAKLQDRHNIDDFRSLFSFYYSGYNLRSTDLQAFIGLGQLKKADSVVAARNKNYKLYHQQFADKDTGIWLPEKDKQHGLTSSFAFPFILPNMREQAIEALAYNNIETRPLICGDMMQQPFIINKWSIPSKFYSGHIADEIHNHGFYVPNHPEVTPEEIKMICDIIKSVWEDSCET